jgi:hypothetical protein
MIKTYPWLFSAMALQAFFRRAQLKALVELHSTDEGLGGTLNDRLFNKLKLQPLKTL